MAVLDSASKLLSWSGSVGLLLQLHDLQQLSAVSVIVSNYV